MMYWKISSVDESCRNIPPSWPVYLILTGVAALWGGTWPIGRFVSLSLDPWTAALIRFILADFVLIAACAFTSGIRSLVLSGDLWPRLILLGATGIFGYSFFFFTGLQTTESARAGLIVGCIPVGILIGSSLVARAWPSGATLSGILLSMAGVWIIVSRGDMIGLLQGDVRIGDLLVLGCVFCWVIYTLIARQVMLRLSPLVTVTWSCLFGTLLILPCALAEGFSRNITVIQPLAWAGLAYLGIPAGGLAYFAYYHAIHRVGGTTAGQFIHLVPLFALLFGWIFLDERLEPVGLFGGLLVLGGVLVAVHSHRRKTLRSR